MLAELRHDASSSVQRAPRRSVSAMNVTADDGHVPAGPLSGKHVHRGGSTTSLTTYTSSRASPRLSSFGFGAKSLYDSDARPQHDEASLRYGDAFAAPPPIKSPSTASVGSSASSSLSSSRRSSDLETTASEEDSATNTSHSAAGSTGSNTAAVTQTDKAVHSRRSLETAVRATVGPDHVSSKQHAFMTGGSTAEAQSPHAFAGVSTSSAQPWRGTHADVNGSTMSRKSARRASSGSGGMGTPSDEHFKTIIRSNGISPEKSSPSVLAIPQRNASTSTHTSLFERKYAAEETRPARRKLHRVDEPPHSLAPAAAESTVFAAQATQPRRSSSIQDLTSVASSASPAALKSDSSSAALKSRSASSSALQSRSSSTSKQSAAAQTMSIASCSTAQVIHLLAELLTKITAKNDEIRRTSASSDETAEFESHQVLHAEPVTPAVPFSTPYSNAASDVNGYFNARSQPNSATTSPKLRSSLEMLRQTSEDKPRTNFSSPSSSPRTRLRKVAACRASTNSRTPRPALLTSAAAALACPNATLCFHARNIPSISIESYLTRISKYCPTTNEVFISLLVYFDRMCRVPALAKIATQSQETRKGLLPDSTGVETFMVDSFNVHRLIIAGVTVASKFFSDVFYTNSRYAKVGGLPLTELNALELQFLLLNDFDLLVQADEIQTYADWLLQERLPPHANIIFNAHESASDEQASEIAGLSISPPKRLQSRRGSPVQSLKSNAAVQIPSAQAVRLKTSFRSASESSTSASETSTVVPSESSVDTERAGDTGTDDDTAGSSSVIPRQPPRDFRSASDEDDDSSDEDETSENVGVDRSHDPFTDARRASDASSAQRRSQSSGKARSRTPVSKASTAASLAFTSAVEPDLRNASRISPVASSDTRRINNWTREWMQQQHSQQTAPQGEDISTAPVVSHDDTPMSEH